MIEARAFVDDLEPVREALARLDADYRGTYKIHDTIFRSTDPAIPLADEFLQLRVITNNIWDGKPVILAVKRTTLHQLGKTATLPTKLEFATRPEAEDYYHAHLRDLYEEDFGFGHVGSQYILPNGTVADLEVIEDDFPTAEIKADTDEELANLAATLSIARQAFITGPSVVVVRRLLHIQ